MNLVVRFRRLTFLNIIFLSLVITVPGLAGPDFDAIPLFNTGPNPDTVEGQKIIEIHERIPDQYGLSKGLQNIGPDYRRGNKIRYEDGPLPYRGFYEPNTVQVLFIGQEGTHFAVWMKLPGGSGFGGRAQDFVMPLGVHETVATMNHSFTTITGQYGFFKYPVINTNSEGEQSYGATRFTPNRLHLLMNEGAIAQVRNEQLAWLIENNKESLKMIVLLGNAASDTGTGFLRHIGADIPSFVSKNKAKSMSLPLTKVLSAGGNNEVAVPIDINGKDVAQELLRKYNDNPRLKLDYSKRSDVTRAQKIIEEHFVEAQGMMIFEEGGSLKNGALDITQFGSNMAKMKVNGVKTQRSTGLQIPSMHGGTFESPDILWLKVTHPSSLSREPETAASKLEKSLFGPMREAIAKGWTPPTPEPGLEAPFLEDIAGFSYDAYGKTDLPFSQKYPQTPLVRIGSSAKAGRAGPDTVIGNTRERNVIDRRRIKEMDEQLNHNGVPENGRRLTHRNPEKFGIFDYQLRYDHEMTDLLFVKYEKVFEFLQKPKRGKTWSAHGKDAYFVKQHPEVGTHGFYRGDMQKPKVITLFDPIGADTVGADMAASGDRGQRIQGLMEDMGHGVDNLVLQTAPFMMDGATQADWNHVLENLEKYHDDIFAEILSRGLPEVFVTDGPQAKNVLERILANYDIDVPVVNIQRGRDFSYGIAAAGRALNEALGTNTRFQHHRADIPEEHKVYTARFYDGSAGDRVITSNNRKWNGRAFAYNVPQFVSSYKGQLTSLEQASLDGAKARLKAEGMILPFEKPRAFVERRARESEGQARNNCVGLLNQTGS